MTTATFETSEELATAVASALLDVIADRQAAGEVPRICLTGGTIADRIHEQIARLAPASGVDWGAVSLWWGDERYVAPDSGDRNALQARRAFIDQVGVPEHRVHEMASTSSACSVDEGAKAYAATVSAGGGPFDVVMLGVGPDGHIASLFPGFAQLDVEDAIAVPVTGSPKPPPERITLTFPALNRAERVWFLVSGQAKAGAVAAALGGADKHEIPAAGIAPVAASGRPGEVIWWLDGEAASQL
ncbi:MAG: 6-phosphogluconolactonase [Nocardioides sp.]